MKNSDETLTASVASLSGIGPQSVLRLEKLGIKTIQDLLFHLPHRYEDRTQIKPINSVSAGMSVLICGTIDFTDVLIKGRKSLICRVSDITGYITLRFFHFSGKLQANLTPGTVISCFGEIRSGFQGLEIIHPEIKVISSSEEITEDYLSPIYPLTEGLRQSTLQKAIKQALTLCLKHPETLIDYLPKSILSQYQFPSLKKALQTLHAPDQKTAVEQLQLGNSPSLRRLAFEEFLAHHLMLLSNKAAYKQWQAPVFKINKRKQQTFIKSLPFTLTHAQQRIIDQITIDCTSSHPMLRLVQGDVGSGKTIVSALAVLLATDSQYQVAIMAPTELLAEQHFQNFKHWFNNQSSSLVFLTGQLKGKKRKEALQSIENGAANIIIGTHALFQDSVKFNNLGLIIIDEQHRFGVHQRLALREKGQHHQQRPHQLVMTATPIPRTLAMLNYSDLDISIIDELPAGRKPVITSVIPNLRREQIIAKINQWTENKHQTYWVCTLIEESEKLQCEAAEKTLEYLKSSLPNVRIALVHGRMKAAEKEAIMHDFKNHAFDLLVATTVIEVGVDVPNASLMIIENAERLGLSQLHQLRGRVGRGVQQSYCLLVYQAPLSETGKQRLGILRESTDGFVIAEKDLQIRGPGDVMGTRQTGQIQLRVANLHRDTDLLEKVQDAAQIIIAQHPETIQAITDRWLSHTNQYAEI